MDRINHAYNLAIASAILMVMMACLLFVPPLRDWFFSHKIWPFPTPWDVKPDQIDELQDAVQPGDVLIERNIHSFHWMALSAAASGSTWVHASIVDEEGRLISMFKTVKYFDFDDYLEKQSTDMVLLRPPYASKADVHRALEHARAKLGTEYDPSFEEPDATCTGLIAKSLEAGGIEVPQRRAFGFSKYIYGAGDFFRVQGMKQVWSLSTTPKRQQKYVYQNAGSFDKYVE